MALQRDMLTRAQVRLDWELLHNRRLDKARKDNDRENKSRIDYEYKPGDLVKLKLHPSDRKWKMNDPFAGPYTVKKVGTNGVMDIDFGGYSEPIHIRRLHPFHDINETRSDTSDISRGGEYHTTEDAIELDKELE